MSPVDLSDRWPLPHAPEVRDAVAAAYADPSRAYHDTRHLTEVLGRLAELASHGVTYDATPVLLAAWFHDAVYDPAARSGTNEEESAALARDILWQLRFADHDIGAVERLIELTARHDADAKEPLDAAFHDADLWILSAPADRFDGYCEQVREEYAQVPDRAYRQSRMAVLEPLLHRDAIYRTSRALRRWETPARLNLGRELARLRE